MKASSSDQTTTPDAPGRTRVLGLPVHAVDLPGAVEVVRRAVRERRRTRVAVSNANKCWLATADPEVRGLLEEAELVVAETAVVWAARVLGRPGVRPAWGVALMARLLEESAREGWSVYLLGGTESVNAAAARAAADRHPGLRVCGRHHGYLDGRATEHVRGELAERRPDLLFVAMGSPLQERFIARLPHPDGPTVAMGVGGSFDVLAGLRREAPAWVRGTGFEWLYRTVQDPTLWKRYALTNPWFVWSVLAERVTGRVPSGPAT